METTLLDSVLRWQVLCLVLLAVTCLVLVGTNILLTWLLWKRRTFTEFHYRLAPSVTATTGSTAYTIAPTPMPGLPDAAVGWHVEEARSTPKARAGKRKRDGDEGEPPAKVLCAACQVEMAVDHLETNGAVSRMVYKCPKCQKQEFGPVP
jgi:hypothetical protein